MNLTIFGLGVVGSNVYNILKNIKKNIETFTIKNKFNCVLKHNKKKYIKLLLYKKIFVELIGGIGVSIEIVLNSIKLKNHIITANKDLISKYYFIINFLLNINNIKMFYEASTCGSIPIINCLKYYFSTEKILYTLCILNGTNNFILTNLVNNNFKKLINLSIKMGFSEKKYSNDIYGFDTNYKSSILISFILKYYLFFLKIFLFSIFGLNKFICKIFYIKKYLLYNININNYYNIQISIFLTKNLFFYKTKNSLNSLFLNCYYSNKHFIIGKGAGGRETASSIVSNYYKVFEKKFFNNYKCKKYNKILNNNYFCDNYILFFKICYNLFFFLNLFKIKIIKYFFFKNFIIIKIKKTFFKKILFLIFFFKKNQYNIIKIL